jgi:hypothetical protein
LATQSIVESILSFELGFIHPVHTATDQGEGIIQVTRSVFQRGAQGEMGSVPAFELQFVPVRQSSLLEFPQSLAEVNEQDSASPNQPGCMRGIRSALAIEAVAALMFYGLWQLSHLLR